MSDFTGPVVGLDSKQIYKEWYPEPGQRKEFRALMGVAVFPKDNADFERRYDLILSELFGRYRLTRHRPVYCAADIGTLLAPRGLAYKSFCLNFARRILSLEEVTIAYFVTRLNSAHLMHGKVTMYGEYGTATREVSAADFIKEVYPYYNVVCAWKLALDMQLKGTTFLLDGMDRFPPTGAWRALSSSQYPKIVYSGDCTFPVISASDIMLRSLDFFLEHRGGITDEDAVRKIILYGGQVPEVNKSFTYIGNPDLAAIKPLRDTPLMPNEVAPFYHHPTIYMGAGGVLGQKSIINGSPTSEKVYRRAARIGASVKLYDPKLDKSIIGSGSVSDLFLPFNADARAQLSALQTSGRNVVELRLEEEVL
ncbi:MAG TPA: hypothetical protein VMV28_08265 [Thermoplasmata archaeon]|nr:hypothetical protein [Thermoplasmata archaeon]